MKYKSLVIIIIFTLIFSSCKITVMKKSDVEKNRLICFELFQSLADDYIWSFDSEGIDSLIKKQILWNDCIAIYATNNVNEIISGYYKNSENRIIELINPPRYPDSNESSKFVILTKKFERQFQGKIEYYGNIYAIYEK